jgi:phosphoglycolate phosphatase-like HAD superfamily hydrolase
MVRLVLFDIDGTLLHTGGAGRKAFRHAFATAFGIANGTEGVEFAGRTDTSLVRELFRRHDVEHTVSNVRHFFDTYYFWLDHILDGSEGRECPGVRGFLHALRALPGPPALGLLTGNVRLGAEIKLRRYGLWHEFGTGGFGDDDEDRSGIARVAHARGSRHVGRTLRGEEILVIGDTPLDVQCARAISARCLAVATGQSTVSELQNHHPTWAVPDLASVNAAAVCGSDGL